VTPSVTIAIDYSFDSSHFFDTQAKKDLMQLAADTVAVDLNDSLAAVTPAGQDTWTADFPNPSTGATQSIPNLVVPANTIIIYVGGGRLSGSSEAGLGSTGGYDASGDQNWLNTVQGRGKAAALGQSPTAYAPWGGSIAFDDSGATNWYFGQALSGLGPSQTDFLSVAEHELGHVLGVGTTPAWSARVSNGFFRGPNAEAAYGGQPVPVNPTGDHWANGVRSDGGPALMDPVLVNGTRVTYTSLDLAALKDIGWQVQISPPVLQFSAPSYNVVTTAGAETVTVTRTGGLGAASVGYATGDGTAHAGTDYQATSGTLTFAPGVLSQTVTIPLLNPPKTGTTTLNLTLSAPTNGALLGSPTTAAINLVNPGTYRPAADFDGDGRTDLGVFFPSNTQWVVVGSTTGLISPVPTFGAPNLSDIPVVGDFDGVGHAEIAVFRPRTTQWFVLGPNGGHLLGTFGGPNLMDIPVPGDYDGVGHAEMAVFRPSTGQWFVLGPNGGHQVAQFGAPNLFDIPAPGDYDGTGRTEPGVYRPSTGQWFALGPGGGHLVGNFGMPSMGDIPVPGDYDGTGRTELAVYRPGTAQWIILGPNGARALSPFGVPNYFDLPVEASAGSLVKLGVIGPGAPRLSAMSLGRPTRSALTAPAPSPTSEAAPPTARRAPASAPDQTGPPALTNVIAPWVPQDVDSLPASPQARRRGASAARLVSPGHLDAETPPR
jgi:hypothetical protein